MYVFLAFLVSFVLPVTAYAQISPTPEPEVFQSWSFAVGGHALALFGILLRLVPRLEPLYLYLPEQWRWLPGAVIAACGEGTGLLTKAQSGIDVVDGLVVVVVMLAAAALPGYFSRQREEAKILGKSTIAILGLLFLGGCAGHMASTAPQAQSPECRRLSNAEFGLRVAGAAAGSLSGATGISAIPVEDRASQRALMGTAAGFAAAAVVIEAEQAVVAKRYLEQCAAPAPVAAPRRLTRKTIY